MVRYWVSILVLTSNLSHLAPSSNFYLCWLYWSIFDLMENTWNDHDFFLCKICMELVKLQNIVYYLSRSEGKHAAPTYWPKRIPPEVRKSTLCCSFGASTYPKVATAMSLFKNGPTLKSLWISIEVTANSCSSVSVWSMLWSPTLVRIWEVYDYICMMWLLRNS